MSHHLQNTFAEYLCTYSTVILFYGNFVINFRILFPLEIFLSLVLLLCSRVFIYLVLVFHVFLVLDFFHVF